MATTDSSLAPEPTAHQKLERALNNLSHTDDLIATTIKLRDEKLAPLLEQVRPIVAQYDPQIIQYEADRERQEAEVARIFQEYRKELLEDGSKTVETPSGIVSARLGTKAVDIYDKEAAMAYARKVGMVKKVTKQPPREFVKNELKKFLGFVAKCPGMDFVQKENLHITLKNKVEVSRELGTIIVPLPPTD